MATRIFSANNKIKLGEIRLYNNACRCRRCKDRYEYTPTDPSDLLHRLREGNWLPLNSQGAFTATPVGARKIVIADRKTGMVVFTIRTN